MDLLRVRDGGVRSVYEAFLWNVVDEGRAIAAEVARLADLVPTYLVDPVKSRFKPILLDFNYFISMDQHDTALALYQDLDDEIASESRVLLSGMANLLDSLATLVTTYRQYVEESCNEASPLGQWDTIRELELESLYLISFVCLELERLYSPATLERIVVLLFRLSDERSPGLAFALDFLHAPHNGEDTLFSRLGLPMQFVEGVLEVFGDRFHEVQVHAHSLSRLRALLPSLLYLALRFRPPTLSNTPRLSRILDLFFRDQWVISIGGVLVNLVDDWAGQRLLSSLLASRITPSRAASLTDAHLEQLRSVDLPQGSIRIPALPTVAPLITKYNAALQWLCIHSHPSASSKKSNALQTAVKNAITTGQFTPHLAMAAVARLEQRYFTVYERCLRHRADEISRATGEVTARLDELVDVLNVTPQLPMKAERKAKLLDWFAVLRSRVEEEAAGAKGAELAMEVKQRVEHVVSSVGLTLTLAAVFPRLSAALDALHALASLSRSHLRSLKASAAAGYAVEMLPSWSTQLQAMLVTAPLPLRALCYKLVLSVGAEGACVHSSHRRGPIRRALAARLSRRLRGTLATLPEQIFEVIDACLVPAQDRSWPAALDKSEVRALADIDERLKLAEGTRALGNLSLGVASLSASSMGAKPREVVADGLREELRKRLTKMVVGEGDVHEVIRRAGSEAALLRTALVSACEQLRVEGSAIWREEVASLFEREADLIVARASKRKTWEDVWIDGPPESRTNGRNHTILHMLLESTDPKKSRYITHEYAWRDVKGRKELFTPSILPSLEASLPGCTASLSLLLRTRAAVTLRGLLAQMKPMLPGADATPDALVRAARSLPSPLADQISALTQSLLLAEFLDHARARSSRLLLPHVSRALYAAAVQMAEESSPSPSLAPLLPLLRHLGLVRSSLTTSSMLSTTTSLVIVLYLAEVGGAQTTLSLLPLPREAIPALLSFYDTVLSGRFSGKSRLPALAPLRGAMEAARICS